MQAFLLKNSAQKYSVVHRKGSASTIMAFHSATQAKEYGHFGPETIMWKPHVGPGAVRIGPAPFPDWRL